MCEIVITLEDINKVPKQALIKLPTWPGDFTIGTKSADLIQLDNGALAREECIRLNAILEQDRREMSGFGDQLMEMQRWAIDKIWVGSFKIDMCFAYGDEDGEVLQLQWCQGTVLKILREEKISVTVEIKWDKECEEREIGKYHKIR